jgi:hypothetical protein
LRNHFIYYRYKAKSESIGLALKSKDDMITTKERTAEEQEESIQRLITENNALKRTHLVKAK